MSLKRLTTIRIKLLQSLSTAPLKKWEIDMTATELRQILQQKWGYSFDLQLRKVKGKIYLQVMWRFLEQASFPLSEAEYMKHLEAVANYLNAWGVEAQFRAFIAKTREKPRLGRAVSIPLDLGSRSSEWILDQ